LAGCAASFKNQPLIPEGAKLTLQSIHIQASTLANRARPVDLDIVYAYDLEALRRLNGYSANGWFSVKETGLIDWKGQMTWQEYRIRPGDQLTIDTFPTHKKPLLAIAFFGRYPNTALHRHIVVGGSSIQVQLEETGFRVSGE